ncbi:hypothetical protein D3C77_311240 [compost metagenome]
MMQYASFLVHKIRYAVLFKYGTDDMIIVVQISDEQSHIPPSLTLLSSQSEHRPRRSFHLRTAAAGRLQR